MGTKYSSNTTSGYNATPPADDGTVSEANKVKWSTIKTKLADPVKDLADTINTELGTHFDRGPTALTSNTTLGASHYNQLIQASGSGVTLTLTDASTLAAAWYCDIYNTDTANSVSLARATAANTIDATSSDITVLPLESLRIFVNAAANGFITNRVKVISGNISFTGDISPAQITANQNDYNPTSLSTSSVLRLNSDAARSITGLAGGVDGRILVIHNIGSFTITFVDESSSSTAANRFALDNNVDCIPDSSVIFQYDSTSSRWRAVSKPLSGVQARLFTSDDSFVASTTQIVATGSGGGGGGGGGDSSGAGGGGGSATACLNKLITGVIPGETLTIDIGALGAGGLGSANGTAGASTTITGSVSGLLLTLNGGSGGLGSGSGAGGSGGAADLANFKIGGNTGNSKNVDVGGTGAGSVGSGLFGTGGAGGAASTNGSNATGYGAGGGGAGGITDSRTGGNGVAGFLLIENA